LSGLVALLSSPVVQNLTHLNLGRTFINAELRTGTPTDITDPDFHTTLATSPFLSNLVSLNLSDIGFINADAVAALAASNTLTNLTHLNLSRNNLDDNLVTQLLSPPSLLAKKLQSINLGSNRLTVSILPVLLEASPLLRELILRGNPELGPAGVSFIATSMPNLTKLDLSACHIASAGYDALAASTALINLRELRLVDNRARAQSIIALVNSPVMANLTHLDLNYTEIGHEVFTAIAQSAALSNLQHLHLAENSAGDEGVIALAQSTTLTNLTWLDLSENEIGADGATALCTSPVASKLTYLRLDYNEEIGNSIATALAAPSSTLYSILELSLEYVEMDDEGVLQLLATTNLDQLNILCIDGNSMDDATDALHQSRFPLFLYRRDLELDNQ
jgi:Ran GTPase-activating protein (RanGAP) involved in mRNA processing and transport